MKFAVFVLIKDFSTELQISFAISTETFLSVRLSEKDSKIGCKSCSVNVLFPTMFWKAPVRLWNIEKPFFYPFPKNKKFSWERRVGQHWKEPVVSRVYDVNCSFVMIQIKLLQKLTDDAIS